MKNKIFLAGTAIVVALVGAACTASVTTTGSTNSSTTASNSPKPAASTTKGAEPPKPTTDAKAAKKPEAGKSKDIPSAKKVPVPASWIYVYDEAKGYGFNVPEGSKGQSDDVEGINVYVAQTPAPSDVSVIVLAYKNQKLTKEDLMNDATKFIEGMGEKVQAGTLTSESDDYSLADATTTDASGKKTKVRILVGTDVTDNYVMIVGTDDAKFDANKDVIDAIWGSFEMWSGGASGNS